jgi:hypothetical protein
MKLIKLIAVVAVMFGFLAQAQLTPNNITKLSVPATIAATVTTNVAIEFDAWSGKDLGIMMLTTPATTMTGSNIVATFSFSGDGTNYSTSTTKATNTLATTTKITGWFVIPYSTIGPARKVRLDSINCGQVTNTTTIEVWTCWSY